MAFGLTETVGHAPLGARGECQGLQTPGVCRHPWSRGQSTRGLQRFVDTHAGVCRDPCSRGQKNPGSAREFSDGHPSATCRR